MFTSELAETVLTVLGVDAEYVVGDYLRNYPFEEGSSTSSPQSLPRTRARARPALMRLRALLRSGAAMVINSPIDRELVIANESLATATG